MSIDGILKGQNTKLYNLYVLLLFVIIGFVIYSNSFSVPFHLDDTAQIQLSKDTKSLDSYKDFWYWTDFISNRPLSKFSLALELARCTRTMYLAFTW
ncbi:MAG: hypothetical protein U5Q03_01895 [Bacteroidota bacterium]|nr:hypothetical protein [Bacteroidota bacterium]